MYALDLDRVPLYIHAGRRHLDAVVLAVQNPVEREGLPRVSVIIGIEEKTFVHFVIVRMLVHFLAVPVATWGCVHGARVAFAVLGRV